MIEQIITYTTPLIMTAVFGWIVRVEVRLARIEAILNGRQHGKKA
jgi:hypothetical protein